MQQFNNATMQQYNNTTMESGYFLINILIAIGIIGIMVTLSIPYIRNFQPQMHLNSSKKKLTSDLRYAQQLTVTEQTIYGMKLPEGSSKYSLLKIEDNATSTVEQYELSEGVSIKEVASSSDNIVKFNFYGGVDEVAKITLENSRQETAQVLVKPSGYVDVN